ncbi:MAG TPA: PD-(D/E)XK nuclease family protein, partial [Bacteroidales bacterium]|nr:PD-(D/E)XK nuclease family protein [Bacteroidales bacterium]
PAYSLIDSVFQLVSHAEKSTGKNDNTPFNRYYRDDILRVLKHPYLLSASGSDSFSLKNVEKVLDHSFYTGIELLEAIGTLSKPLAELFDPGFSKSFVSPSDLLALHQKIVQYLSNSFTGTERKLKPEAIDKEYLFSVSLVIQNVRELISGLPEEIDMETLGVLFATLAGAARLPFYGEPLTGLQVMGVLETRTLDFETLIMVSVNEGLLPKGKLQNSFIPADIRQAFALPGYREHNAVFAYHFYRLLQRAKTTWLLYNTESDELGNGEKSRFITQMLYELPRYNPGIKIIERVISMPSPAVANDTISISKDSTVAQRLIELAQSGFSPSMLSTYLNCGLQFYFSSILGLSEPDTIDETIDASILGTSVHSALQKLYQPFVGKTVDSQIVRTLIASSAEVVKQEFRSLFSHCDLETGKNMIIVHMAQNMVRRLLETEAEILEPKTGNQLIRIQHLEKRLESDIQLNIQGNDVPLRVKIKGIADRIDTYDGQVRIIDYKTGSLDKRELELPSIQALPEMKKPQKVLQLLTYAWMYDRSYSEPVKLTSGIIALKMPRRYLQKVLISRSEILDQGMLSDFESYLTGLLFDIFAPELTFQQTNNQAICVYCSFKSICNR